MKPNLQGTNSARKKSKDWGNFIQTSFPCFGKGLGFYYFVLFKSSWYAPFRYSGIYSFGKVPLKWGFFHQSPHGSVLGNSSSLDVREALGAQAHTWLRQLCEIRSLDSVDNVLPNCHAEALWNASFYHQLCFRPIVLGRHAFAWANWESVKHRIKT